MKCTYEHVSQKRNDMMRERWDARIALRNCTLRCGAVQRCIVLRTTAERTTFSMHNVGFTNICEVKQVFDDVDCAWLWTQATRGMTTLIIEAKHSFLSGKTNNIARCDQNMLTARQQTPKRKRFPNFWTADVTACWVGAARLIYELTCNELVRQLTKSPTCLKCFYNSSIDNFKLALMIGLVHMSRCCKCDDIHRVKISMSPTPPHSICIFKPCQTICSRRFVCI